MKEKRRSKIKTKILLPKSCVTERSKQLDLFPFCPVILHTRVRCFALLSVRDCYSIRTICNSESSELVCCRVKLHAELEFLIHVKLLRKIVDSSGRLIMQKVEVIYFRP